MGIKKKVLIGTIGLSLFTSGAFAGTVIKSYKTPRGNVATVEKEDVHKNRIGITVNGQKVEKDTWFSNGVTYAPLRDVSEILGTEVSYNSKTMSADITFKGYDQTDISYIKSINKLNQTISSTDHMNNTLSGFWYSLNLAFSGILINNTVDELSNTIDNLNGTITRYKTTTDYITRHQMEIREEGFLTQKDIDLTMGILTNLTNSIEQYKLGIENLKKYYETKKPIYVDNYKDHNVKGQNFALEAGSLTFDAKLYYFEAIENYSKIKTRVSTASLLMIPEYKKIGKIEN